MHSSTCTGSKNKNLHYYVLQVVGHGSLGNRDQAARPPRKWAVLAPTFFFNLPGFHPGGEKEIFSPSKKKSFEFLARTRF